MKRPVIGPWILAMGVFITSSAHAHLMPRNHGTLNVTNGKAYIVLALPISLFSESEAQAAIADGVPPAELKMESQRLKAAIREGLVLSHQTQAVPIGRILLNLPKGPHHTPERSTEITAMIVAPLKSAAGSIGPIDITLSLWGADTQSFKLKATLTQSGKTVRSELVEFTPKATRHRVFESSAP